MKLLKNIAIVFVAVTVVSLNAMAAGAAKHPEKQVWSFDGITGHYDRASAQRGFQVYREVCASCHSLKYFHFRNLADLGYGEDMIKAFAAEYEVAGDPDDYGDPTTRAALPQDVFPAPFANDNAARASNGGALPPDLSLITKARHDGSNYTFALLTGYSEVPTGHTNPDGTAFDLTDGKYFNPYFKGEQIAMAPPISDDLLEYEDGTPATMDQMSRDVVQFLTYVAEPKLEDRLHMGLNVMLFLAFFTLLAYFSYRKVWANLKK